jgi:hypothetical protein
MVLESTAVFDMETNSTFRFPIVAIIRVAREMSIGRMKRMKSLDAKVELFLEQAS